jgi:hypothetical protein
MNLSRKIKWVNSLPYYLIITRLCLQLDMYFNAIMKEVYLSKVIFLSHSTKKERQDQPSLLFNNLFRKDKIVRSNYKRINSSNEVPCSELRNERIAGGIHFRFVNHTPEHITDCDAV